MLITRPKLGVLALFLLIPPGALRAHPPLLQDKGIFSDLDPLAQQVSLATLSPSQQALLLDPPHNTLTLVSHGVPLKAYPIRPCGTGKPPADTMIVLEKAQGAIVLASSRQVDTRRARIIDSSCQPPPSLDILMASKHLIELSTRLREGAPVSLLPPKADKDKDGIPDAADILLGARKCAANRAAYTEGYQRIPYPGGDVSRSMGVCTDVIVRALRNAGYDLQALIQKDYRARPKAYPAIRKADPHIDHRRVRNLLVYFRKHWSLIRADQVRPGDVVFLDTFPSRAGAEHIGIIADTLGSKGLPLVINNWTTGFVTQAMDLLPFVPITHAFRAP